MLAILALLIGLVSPSLYRGLERERFRAALRSFNAVLRLARSVAVTERQRVRVFVDLERGGWWLEGGGRSGTWPAGTRVAQASLVWPDRSQRQGYIAFYPDGSSSGGQLELLDRRGAHYLLKVDIVTSRVDVDLRG